MNQNNYTYKHFFEQDYSAMEIVNLMHNEFQPKKSKNRMQFIIENFEGFIIHLKNEIYQRKIEFEKETGKHLKFLTNQLAIVVTYLENIINNSTDYYKNGINYKRRKLKQMSQEIAVLGLYLEI